MVTFIQSKTGRSREGFDPGNLPPVQDLGGGAFRLGPLRSGLIVDPDYHQPFRAARFAPHGDHSRWDRSRWPTTPLKHPLRNVRGLVEGRTKPTTMEVSGRSLKVWIQTAIVSGDRLFSRALGRLDPGKLLARHLSHDWGTFGTPDSAPELRADLGPFAGIFPRAVRNRAVVGGLADQGTVVGRYELAGRELVPASSARSELATTFAVEVWTWNGLDPKADVDALIVSPMFAVETGLW